MARDVDVVFRPLTQWPVGRARTPDWQREDAKFKRAGYAVDNGQGGQRWTPGTRTSIETTYTDLERELSLIEALDVVVQIDVRETARYIRADGSRPLADARVQSPAIVLTFKRKGMLHTFACDRFQRWQDNLRGIVLGLEGLRRLERYGIVQSGEQYRGWQALPASTSPTMTTGIAAGIIAEYSGEPAHVITADPSVAKGAVRSAIHRTHPDRNNGGRVEYDRVDTARKVLSSHHGVSL